MAKKHRFEVIEYVSGYAVRDRMSGKERWMSDGVDVLTTPTGRSMKPGSEYFRRKWQQALNEWPADTCDAYGFTKYHEHQRNRIIARRVEERHRRRLPRI